MADVAEASRGARGLGAYSRRQLARAAILVVASCAAAVPAWQYLSAWLAYGRDQLFRTDFALYYVFSRIGTTYGWNRLYDLTAQRQVYDATGPIWWFPLPYTPPMGWLTAPLTLLPLQTAYWVWALIVALAYLGAWWLASPREVALRVLTLIAPLGLYLVWLGLSLGQVLSLQMLSVAGCYWLLKRGRDVWAGLALLGVVVHPQGFFLVPLVVLATGRWKAFVSFAAGSAVIGSAAVLTLRRAGLRAFVSRLQEAQANPDAFFVPHWINLPSLLGAHPHLAIGVQACLVAIVLLAAWRSRGTGFEVPLAMGLIGSVLVTSFIHLDDLMVLVVAAWLTLRRWPDIRVVVLLAVAYGVALLQTNVGTMHYGWLMVGMELTWLLALAVFPVPVEVTEWAHRHLRLPLSWTRLRLVSDPKSTIS
jgi:hypothetical protein